jgi:hypothetical protein
MKQSAQSSSTPSSPITESSSAMPSLFTARTQGPSTPKGVLIPAISYQFSSREKPRRGVQAPKSAQQPIILKDDEPAPDTITLIENPPLDEREWRSDATLAHR